jgi:predicted outer membrane lipoprotein
MNTMDLLSLGLGLVLGSGFAALQWLALEHRESLERQQQAPRWWRLLPGSATRVGLLLMGLVLVQLLCPRTSLWWLTTGLVAATVVSMSLRLKRMTTRRH